MFSSLVPSFVSLFAAAPAPRPAERDPQPLKAKLSATVADLLAILSLDGYTFEDRELDRDAVAGVVRLALRMIRLGRALPDEQTTLAPAHPAMPLWERLTDAAATIEALLREGFFRDADFEAASVAAFEALTNGLWEKLEDHFASVPTPDADDDDAEAEVETELEVESV